MNKKNRRYYLDEQKKSKPLKSDEQESGSCLGTALLAAMVVIGTALAKKD